MRLRFHQPPPSQAGFVLPLATTLALVLLLSSLSLQAAAWQNRLQLNGQWRQRQHTDAAHSAAQQAAALLHGHLHDPATAEHRIPATLSDLPVAVQHHSADHLTLVVGPSGGRRHFQLRFDPATGAVRSLRRLG